MSLAHRLLLGCDPLALHEVAPVVLVQRLGKEGGEEREVVVGCVCVEVGDGGKGEEGVGFGLG